MAATFKWFPQKPPIGADANDFVFKRWFQTVYQYLFGTSHAANSQTANLTGGQEYFYPIDATSGAVTFTLPLASQFAYKRYRVVKTDSSANAVTVGISGSDTIQGATTLSLSSQYSSYEFYSDGITTWYYVNTQGSSGGGVLKSQEFTTPGANTFNVPAGVTAVWLTMIGAGAGGGGALSAQTAGKGGGGSGELIENIMWPVTAGGTATVTIGSKGTGGAGGNGTAGGDTSFNNGTMTVTAKGGNAPSAASGGTGGGVKGGANGAPGVMGTAESPVHFGGSGAGNGGAASGAGAVGGPAAGHTGGAAGSASGTAGGGGGGGASIYGNGAAAGSGNANGSSAPSTSYGAGGGGSGGDNVGAGNRTGGDGAPGYCLVSWIA